MSTKTQPALIKTAVPAVLAAHLLERGITQVVEDSSGNAGASLAGYAARTGIHAKIFVPAAASGPKREQIVRYGAELVMSPDQDQKLRNKYAQKPIPEFLMPAMRYIPFGLAGIATIAYELYLQTSGSIGTIIAPVGHGGLLLGIMHGFRLCTMQELSSLTQK